jgi:hypothetical protein
VPASVAGPRCLAAADVQRDPVHDSNQTAATGRKADFQIVKTEKIIHSESCTKVRDNGSRKDALMKGW